MIEAKVLIDIDTIECNGFSIYQYTNTFGERVTEINDNEINEVSTLEEAIKYCLEKDNE